MVGGDQTSSAAFEVGGSDGADFAVGLCDHQIGPQAADQIHVDVIQRLAGAYSSPDFGVDFAAGTEISKAGPLHAGRVLTQGGLSHSWERPTNMSPAPSAQIVSVALASKETMRTLCDLGRGFEKTPDQGESAEDRGGINSVAQELIAIERNGCDKAGSEPV